MKHIYGLSQLKRHFKTKEKKTGENTSNDTFHINNCVLVFSFHVSLFFFLLIFSFHAAEAYASLLLLLLFLHKNNIILRDWLG